jgi:hypothetical protein
MINRFLHRMWSRISFLKGSAKLAHVVKNAKCFALARMMLHCILIHPLPSAGVSLISPMCEGVVARQLTPQLALWIPCALCVTAGFFPTTSVDTCQDARMVSGVIVSTAHWDWDWAWERIHRFRATFASLVHALCFCLSLSSKGLEC